MEGANTTENIPTYPDLTRKISLITGGSGRIGAATRRLLAANGAKVAIVGRNETKIGAVVDEIRADGDEAIGVAADVAYFAAIERMRGGWRRNWGRSRCWPRSPVRHPVRHPVRPTGPPRRSGERRGLPPRRAHADQLDPAGRTPSGRVVAPRRGQRRPGALLLDGQQRLISVLTLDIAGNQITSISAIANPDMLTHLGPVADARSLLRFAR